MFFGKIEITTVYVSIPEKKELIHVPIPSNKVSSSVS